MKEQYIYSLYLRGEKLAEVSDVCGAKIKVKPFSHVGAYLSYMWLSNCNAIDADTSVYIPVPKHYRCKGRNRYKKLLMSIGLDRNTADRFARAIGKMRDKPYRSDSFQDVWVRQTINTIECGEVRQAGETR